MVVTFTKETNFKVVEADGFKFEVPEDWEVVRLENKRHFKIIMGQSPPSSTYNQDGKGLPFLQGSAEFGSIYPKPQLYTTQPMKIAKENDILISVRAPVGDVNIAPFELCIGRGLAAIRVNRSEIENMYVFYFLTFAKSRLENIGSGSTFKGITKSTLEELNIPLPPLPEQQKIAHVLMSIDKAIEAVDEAIKQAECIKKGLMQELLTKGIGHTEFKDTEIGRIPKEWEVVRLGDVVEIYDSKRIPLSEQERSTIKGPYPYCGATGIIDYIDDYIFEGEYVLLAEDGGYFGPFEQSAYIMNGKFWVNNHAHVLKAKNGISDNWYLMYFLNYIDLRHYIVGSTRTKLNQADMRRIKISLPPLPEQQKIAEILSKWDEVIELKKAKKERLERMKKKVMDLLLTGKVRIK